MQSEFVIPSGANAKSSVSKKVLSEERKAQNCGSALGDGLRKGGAVGVRSHSVLDKSCQKASGKDKKYSFKNCYNIPSRACGELG